MSRVIHQLDDGQLVARCRDGDSEAWNHLVERFSPYVYAICRRGFRLSDHDAEDVFQDVFTRVYLRLDSLREARAVRPWIAQVTRRLCLDRIADGGRELPADEILLAGADSTLETLEEAWTVREALARLGGVCEDILDRFFAQDQSYRTIGEELGLPSGTIASRISRCLAKLRTQFEGRNPAPGASVRV